MRRVESYAALTPLLSAQLRRGVVTNCFLSPADYQSEIDAGLFYEEGDGFLLLLRQRAGYRLLNFYLHPGAKLCLPEQPSPLITELACREKDQDAMRRAQDALCALGFTVVKPDGTFYIFPKALEEDAKAFCRKAQKYDLALVPGDSFGCPGYFRMAYCIGTEKVRRSFAALERFVAAEYGVTKQ